MAIHASGKQSDLEKRLKLLRQQVYGQQDSTSLPSYQYSQKAPNNAAVKSDVQYLKTDLLKIFIFSAVAIGAQIVLFLSLKKMP